MKFKLQRCILMLFLMLIPFCRMEIYQLPPTLSSMDESIRLNSIHIINEPDLQLNKIYKREIYQKLPESLESNSTTIRPFSACQQSSPEISFDFVGYCPLERPGNWTTSFNQTSGQVVYTRKFELIYDYEELKSQYKNIVDMVFYSSHVFTISSAGVINVYRVDEQILNGIELRTTIEAIDWDEQIRQRIFRYKKQQQSQPASDDTENPDQSSNKTSEQGQQNAELNNLPESLKYRHLGKGYFQFMDGNQLLLFSNGEFLIAFDIRTFKTTILSEQQNYAPLSANQSSNATNHNAQENQDQSNSQGTDNIEQKQYQILQNFQSVTKIDENHFAVLDRKKGAIVYRVVRIQISPQTVQLKYHIQKVDVIGKQRFGNAYKQDEEMNLVDIEYNKQTKMLFMLDYEKGVFSFDLGSAKLINKSEYIFLLNPNMIFKKQCSLMEFSQISQTLYLVCSKIYRISLMKWPIVQEKIFPHPMINIRQIFIEEEKNIFVLAGYSVFKVMYLDRPTDYFQDDMLDKIFFNDKMVITANEYHIVVYNYDVEKPLIVCQTSNQSLLGTHNVVLKTTAECQQSYLQQINRTKQQKSKFDPEDICVYTVHKSVYVWEQGQIITSGLTIFIIVFLIFALLMLLWYFITIWRSRRARTYLMSLAGQGHAALVQENAPRSQAFKGNNEAHPEEVGQTHTQINKNLQNENLESNLNNI